MQKPTSLYQMQLMQKKHDSKFHQDIFFLPYLNRMQHYVNHYTKYVARFAGASSRNDELIDVFAKTYTDTFIINLCASDVCNLNLDERIRESFGKVSRTIMGYAGYVRGQKITLEEMRRWSIKSLSGPNGSMAKALEELDHLKPSPGFNSIINNGITEITRMVLIGSNLLTEYRSFDIVDSTVRRWKELEERRIL